MSARRNAQAGAPVRVQVTRSGRTFAAQALCHIDAAAAVVWETITDYEGLPRFMPGIRACRVIERVVHCGADERLLLEQEGEFRFLLLRQALKVRLAVEHQAGRIATARAIDFDLGVLKGRAVQAFEGRYELQPGPGRGTVQLRYDSRIVSRLPPPPGIGAAAVRQNLEAQLAAVVAECARRAASGARRRAGGARGA